MKFYSVVSAYQEGTKINAEVNERLNLGPSHDLGAFALPAAIA